MGIEEKLPSGVLLTTVEGVAGYMRKASFWPATFGLACCAIEMMTSGGPKYDLARFGMEVFRASPRQADLMIVAGRVSQKMAPVLRQIYDQMAEPKWVLAMGVCASSGGMFNNYAIVQGVDHVVPVDMYLPGCPPRPEMLIDAILKLHDQVQHTKLGSNRLAEIEDARGEGPQRPAHQPDEGADEVMADEKAGDPSGPGSPESTDVVAGTQDHSLDTVRETSDEVVARREGMFGVRGTGDTSGYGGLQRTVEMPGATEPPYGGWMDDVADALVEADPLRRAGERGREGRRAPRRDHLLRPPRGPGRRRPAAARRRDAALRVLLRRQRRALPRRRRPRAARRLPPALDDPQPADPPRGHRPDADPHIPSVVATYPTADWHERETFDFFGIVFDGHPALTRIQMPDDWPGHPQRKDYPLGGIPVEYKGGTIPPPDQRRSYN